MRKFLIALACAAGLTASGPAIGQAQPAAAASSDAARALLRQVDIPFETFTLDNGLRVVVHEDRKAPVVSVQVWYNVGSKDEPAGQTGFAHLFEHMLFYGSENVPGQVFEHLERMGATDWNGSTWFDRTNYYETVPTSALETAMYLESDRMGYLLGAVTEEKLRNQISVVQNEKRQGDNQPFGLVSYAELETLFPEGHPYRHSTIGSMADLDASTLPQVQQWFRDRYGPNNAVLALAGDIDTATARRLAQRYFGGIPRGPVNTPAAASVPTLPARVDRVMNDRVATTRLSMRWAVPGLGQEDNVALQLGAGVLGGLSSSRLDNILVRDERLAVNVSASVQTFQRVSFFRITVDVRPGVDADQVQRRLEEILANYLREGPTADEVRRVSMQALAARIRGLEQVGDEDGKAGTLASGLLYMNDPGFYRRELAQMAEATPAGVQRAVQRWLSRPVFALRIVPGERGAYQEAASGRSSNMQSAPRNIRPVAGQAQAGGGGGGGGETGAQAAAAPAAPPRRTREPMPQPGPVGNVDFPSVERGTLSNGVRVVLARRATVPVVRVSMSFNAGFSADSRDRLGLQSLMAGLLDEGTTSRNAVQIAEERERLGAQLTVGASVDRTTASLAALRANLDPSLDLMADILQNPAFAQSEIERLKAQQSAQIAAEQAQPIANALRTLPPLLYGAGHAYGVPFTGSGTVETLQAITRADILGAHQRWIRPDNLEIFVVGDTTMADIMPRLERRFGRWRAPSVPRGTKTFAMVNAPANSRIVIVDRPQSPQSLILGGLLLPAQGTADLLAVQTAIEALGGGPSARLYQDLRETKGWTYGAYSYINNVEHQVPMLFYAPVQTNRTGESVAALRDHVRAFLSDRRVSAGELERIVSTNVRGLPGSYETSPAVLNAIAGNALYRRPDDYQESLAARYRAMTTDQLNEAASAMIRADGIVWVVVGDAAQVRPQLERLGLPIETMTLQ